MNDLPLYLFFPFIAAAVYALSSLFLKRALTEGVRLRQSVHITNIMVGTVVTPLYFLEEGPIDWRQVYYPLAMGLCFYAAGWLTVIAVRRGDVSLVTPLMGTKVVFVAIGSMLMLRESLPPLLLFAAGLATSGIIVLGIPDMRGGRNFGITTGITLLSAALYGVCDLMVQNWAWGFGKLSFIAVASNEVALLSLLAILLTRLPGREVFEWPGKGQRYWIWMSALLLALQALVVGSSLAIFRDATGINVVYASRGLWAILLVWIVGHWMGNFEMKASGRLFVWRIVGTVMLTVAIVLAVVARAQI